MNAKLFISNINYEATDEDVIELFASKGEVVSFRLVRDRYSGQSKGFGFIEMGSSEQAEACIEELNGALWMDRPLVVKPQRDRPAGPPQYLGGGNHYGDQRGYGGGGYGYQDREPAYSGGGYQQAPRERW